MEHTQLATRTLARRADRALFRSSLPHQVGHIVIEWLVRWEPGGEGHYAEGVVITSQKRADGVVYSVHNVTWRDNDHTQPWILFRGMYDIETFGQAMKIATVR